MADDDVLHGCNRCHQTGKVGHLRADSKVQTVTCPACNGYGFFLAPADKWSTKNTRPTTDEDT